MRILLSWDHAGHEAAKTLKEYLTEKGHQVAEFGPKEYNKTDDYPDFVIPAMKNMQKEPDSLAILLCRNGAGVSILANKFKGVRASISFNPMHAKSLRTDDNANVLAIPSHYLSDEEMFDVADAFLQTKYSGLDRHDRRLKKVALEEEENLK